MSADKLAAPALAAAPKQDAGAFEAIRRHGGAVPVRLSARWFWLVIDG